jgi:hypothetical protein
VTQRVLDFLQHSRLQMADNIAAEIANGTVPLPSYVENVALRCEVYGDLCALSHEDINSFYSLNGEEENGN